MAPCLLGSMRSASRVRVTSLLNVLVRILLAPGCAACRTPLDQPLAGCVCAACWRAVPTLTPPCCRRCGDALAPSPWPAESSLCRRCRRNPPVVELARSAGEYDGSLREIIHAFKYERRRALARPLAALMREAGHELLADADAVVPVPLHPWRAFGRGFNQAEDLARHLGAPVWPLLRRQRYGPPQATLPAGQRHTNVRNAFALRRLPYPAYPAYLAYPAYPAYPLKDRILVLVDDVMTTGATLEACAEVLRDSGARSVRALTVARAVATRTVRRQPRRRPLIAPRQ